MFRYRAFGLQIESEIPLPELVPGGPEKVATVSDLVIRPANLSSARPADAVGGPLSWAASGQVCLHFDAGGQFLCRNGRELLVHRAPGVDDAAIRHFLLGPMLGVILHQRGYLVLHASAARINGCVVAFLAEKGTGKSTLAAAFHAAGHTLVSDDVVPVNLLAAGGPITYPGFPQLKLFPEAAAQLGAGAESLPILLPGLDKRARRLEGAFPTDPLPIRRIYVLEDGDAETASGLAPQQAFMSLVRHSFTLALLKATATDTTHFRQAVELSRLIPVKSLARRRQLSVLPDVVRLVEDDLTQDLDDVRAHSRRA